MSRSINSLWIVVLIVIAIIAVVVFSPACQRHKPFKVCVVGLDSATWNIIDPLIAEDVMPNFKRVLEGGVRSTMIPFAPCNSIELWTTMATGKLPAKHGISSWVEYNPDLDRYVPITSNSRKTKALWNILGDFNKTSFFVNWYATWPAESVNGIMLTNRFRDDPSPESVWPHGLTTPDLPAWSIEKITSMQALVVGELTADTLMQEPTILRESLEHFSREFYREEYLATIGHKLYAAQRPRSDLFAIMLRALDSAQHFFWQYSYPQGFSPSDETIARYRSIIPRLYVHYDRLLGNFLASLDDDTILIIVSDHGMSGFLRENLPRSYVNFEDTSLFFPDEDGHCIIRRIRASQFLLKLNAELQTRGMPLLRWCDAFYAENLVIGHNWRLKLCLEGKGPDASRHRDEILHLLRNLHTEDPRSTPLFSAITPADSSEFDVLVQFSQDIPGDATFILAGEHLSWSDFLEDRRNLSGFHLEDEGIVVFYGPGVKQGVRIPSFSAQDITPTILNLLRIPIAKDMDGRARLDFLPENMHDRFRPQTIETHDLHFRPATRSRDSDQDKRILEELTSLGYISDGDAE